MLKEVRIIPSLPLIPSPLLPVLEVLVRAPPMAKIDLCANYLYYYYLFVMPPRASSFFTIFSEKKYLCTEHIQYLLTDQILLSYPSDSSQNYPLKFFFLPFFLKLTNFILEFSAVLLFLIF